MTRAQDTKSGVMGKVVDSGTGEVLGFASVGFFRTDALHGTIEAAPRGAVGKGDGSYRVPLAPGTYRAEIQYISYHTLKVAGILVKENEFTTLDFTLTPSAVQLKTVEVTAQEVRTSEAAVLSQRKKAAASSDAISSEQIKRTSDGNAAEVATRVTGVSVIGDRYVNIRGLGERYNSTMLDGATIASPEPDRRVAPLDLFPSDLVDNLVVQKSYTPDLPGEFAGGAVNINTRQFPGERMYSFSVSTGYNTSTTGEAFQTYAGGKRDALGMDDGTRDFPDLVKQLASQKKIVEGNVFSDRGFSADTLAAFGRAFNKVWTPQSEDGSPAFSFSGSYGDQFAVFGRDLGFFAGASLKNSFQSYDFDKNVFESANDEGVLTPTATYKGTSSESEVLWGSLLHSSFRISDAHTVSVRAMYDRSSEDEVRFYEGYEGDTSQRPIRDTRFQFIERGIFSGTVETESSLRALGDSKVHLRGTYSQSERNEPDRREYVYEYFEERTFEDPATGEQDTTAARWELSSVSPDKSFSRFFSELDDIERGVDGSWSVPFPAFGGLDGKVKAGFALKNKDRDFFLRRFTYTIPLVSAGVDLSLPPDSLMTDENIAGSRVDGFVLEERTRSQDTPDNYNGSQNIRAEYLMVDVPVTTAFRAVVGARVETSEQSILAYDYLNHLQDPITARLENTDVLPSINLTYALKPSLNLRSAYFKTLARPELREIAPYSIANFQGDFEEEGNPDLKRSRIHNYDVRLEYFPGANEVVAVSGFYKQLLDPIEKSVQGGDDPVYKPINGQGGFVRGVEFESRLGLGRIADPLDSFGFNGNLTLVKSETELDRLGIQFSKERPLQEQSPYVANVGLTYASGKDRTQVALLYNVFGRRIRYVGFGTLPDIYEEPRETLDLTMSHGLAGARLKIAMENILDAETRFEQGDQVTDLYDKGRSFSVALSYGSR